MGKGRRLSSVGLWLVVACGLVVVLASCASPSSPGAGPTAPPAGPGPRFAANGPDARDYGAGEGYPIGDRSTFFTIPFLVGAQSHLDQVFEGRPVRRASVPSPLGRAASEPTIRFEYQGQTITLDDYLARHPTTALLIARGDTILVERYQYGRNDRHRFTSWSMAKTVTAMLVGIANAEGRIRSVDDRAEAYVPGLAGTEYGRTSLRHLLQMSSGVRFVEEYTGNDDIAQLARDTFLQLGTGGIDAVRKFNQRAWRAARASPTPRLRPRCSASC